MTTININDIPVNAHSSDFSDSSESYDDSFSESKKESLNNVKIEEKELNNIEIIINKCEIGEENEDINEAVKIINNCEKKKDKKNMKFLNLYSTYDTLKKTQSKKNTFEKNENGKKFLRKKRFKQIDY